MFNKIKRFINSQIKSKGSISLFPEHYSYNRGRTDKRKYAQEGYIINCIFNACVTKIVNQALTIPIKIVNKKKQEVESLDLQRILDKPNHRQGYQSFLTSMVIDYFVFGDIYIRKNITKEEDTAEAMPQYVKPISLSLLRPFNMEIYTDDDGYPAKYIYNTKKGKRLEYICDITEASQIIHIKTENPLDNKEGVSSLESCAISVDLHNMAGAWNVSLLQKGAKLDTALKANRPLTEEEVQEVKENFKRFNSGFSNAGEPAVIDTDLEIMPVGLSPNDMDWLAGYEVAMKNICVALGVPVDLIYGQSTYENLKTANEQLAENTTIPMMELFINSLNKRLVPLFDKNLSLMLDIDKMPAMMLKKVRQRESLEMVSFLTINEKRAMIGLDEVEGGDVLLINASQVPLTDITEPLPLDD